jgi:hypothetical protein
MAIIGFVDGAISLLWKHTFYKSFSVSPARTENEDEWEQRFSRRGAVLWVSGKRKTIGMPDDKFGWPPGTTNDLPSETWCWVAAAKKYRLCLETLPGYVTPEIGALLKEARGLLQGDPAFRTVSILWRDITDERAIQWVGAAWGDRSENSNKDGGALFVLARDGARLDVLSLPEVDGVRKGPTLPGIGPTVEIVHTPRYGTDDGNSHITVAAFVDGKIVTLWTHPIMITANDSQDWLSDQFSWHIPRNGEPIRTRAYRVIERGLLDEDIEISKLPEQLWCWIPAEMKYLACDAP